MITDLQNFQLFEYLNENVDYSGMWDIGVMKRLLTHLENLMEKREFNVAG